MKRAVKHSAILLSALCAGIFGYCIELQKKLPDEITAYKNETIVFNDSNTVGVNNRSKKETSVSSQKGDLTYTGSIELFHIIPVKAVTVHQTEKKFVVPCGTLFGIKFYARGVAVIECCDITTGTETVNPGKAAGLRPGDTILAIDGVELSDCGDVERLTQQSGGDAMHLKCLRDGTGFETDITPKRTGGVFRLGLWIKDSAAGLGTMTFYDPENGRFASLGHGICDNDTGGLLELDRAEITQVEIASITKAADGLTGSINGYFSDSPPLGTASLNSECGLYGDLRFIPQNGTPVEVANIQEVRRGGAQILCSLDNAQPRLYDIEITKVDYDEKNKTKNLQIVATDKRLIEKTGGIVQGMSGSPILQNGKLVGAVTHVLITNSAKGYGIFAQNMFDEMEKTRN